MPTHGKATDQSNDKLEQIINGHETLSTHEWLKWKGANAHILNVGY